MFHIKNRPQPTLTTRPSVLAGRDLLPVDGVRIINEAGKCRVKTPSQTKDLGGIMKALAEQIAELDGVEIYGRVVGVRGLMVEVAGPIHAMSVGSRW
jgi:hypothetical protein